MKDRPMETVQTQTQPTRVAPMPMWAALLKLLAQPTRKPLFSGKKVRSGYTKNKSLGESKTRRRMAKESRRRNRP